jgi:hypothetical protein
MYKKYTNFITNMYINRRSPRIYTLNCKYETERMLLSNLFLSEFSCGTLLQELRKPFPVMEDIGFFIFKQIKKWHK